jgi:hypothetical protein
LKQRFGQANSARTFGDLTRRRFLGGGLALAAAGALPRVSPAKTSAFGFDAGL